MAKRVRLSDDDGTTWYTLPGNSAELSSEAGAIDDTIFGYDFESMQSGLVGANVSANGLYKGFAGYVAVINKGGTPTGMTDEATTLVSGKTYQINDTTKRVIDRDSTIVVDDDATPVAAANIESIDYLFGRVTFVSSYTVNGAVTISADYIPLAQVAKGQTFNLTQTANMVDNSDFVTVQGNSGHRIFTYGLKTVSLELGGIYALSNGWAALLDARTELVIEINPDGDSKSTARGIFKALTNSQSGDVGDLELETVTFALSVPDDIPAAETPFKWVHANDTTLSQALQVALTAWQDSATIDVEYLHDGTNGVTGDCLINDVSLSGGLEVMNEFTVGAQITGALSAVP